MNKFECIISGAIIGVIALALIFKAVGMAFVYIVDTCANTANQIISFFGMAPPLFWGLAIVILVTIGLIWVALKMYYSIVNVRNKASIVEVESKRAIAFQGNDLTAISFEGEEITTRRIERQPRMLTDTELRILERRRKERQRQIEDHSSSASSYSPGSGSITIPGCHN